MKKLLLSSIIMFGVCGIVNAQNATESKFKKAETQSGSAAATPQKAAVAVNETPVIANIDGTTALRADDVTAPAKVAQTDAEAFKQKEAQATNPAPTGKKTKDN